MTKQEHEDLAKIARHGRILEEHCLKGGATSQASIWAEMADRIESFLAEHPATESES